jgi:peptidoglycan/LPS O-acetylase OafA/YrhL
MIANIQALRGIAAVGVAAYHFRQHYEFVGGTWLFDPFLYGWIGVDLFFVISGYVIWHTTRGCGGKDFAAHFLIRRFARIFLGYWPWFLATVLLLLILAPGALLRHDLLRSALLLPQPHKTNLLAVSWTLSFELLFYFGFSVLLLLPRRTTVPALLGIGALVVGASTLGVTKTFLLSPLILEFLAGALLAAAVDRFGAPAPWAGILIAIAFCIAGEGVSPGDRVLRVLTFGVASVGTVYAAVGYEQKGRRFSGLPIALGDASYSLYLCHIPVLMIVRWTVRDDLSAAPELAYGALLTATVVFSLWWYRTVEDPLYKSALAMLRTRRYSRSRWRAG